LEKDNVGRNWTIYRTLCYVTNCRLLLWRVIMTSYGAVMERHIHL